MTETKTVTYQGDRALRRGVADMAKRGFAVQSHSTRKAMFSVLTGVLTNQQIHTVIFAHEVTTQAEADAQQGEHDAYWAEIARQEARSAEFLSPAEMDEVRANNRRY